MYNKLFMNR